MGILVRAVVTGFGLAMGAAIFKKVAPYVKLDEKKVDEKPSTTAADVVQRGDGDGEIDGTLVPSN